VMGQFQFLAERNADAVGDEVEKLELFPLRTLPDEFAKSVSFQRAREGHGTL
jgi:hypothetical protein